MWEPVTPVLLIIAIKTCNGINLTATILLMAVSLICFRFDLTAILIIGYALNKK